MRLPENHTRTKSRWAIAALSLLCALIAAPSAVAADLPDGRGYEIVNPPGLDVSQVVRVPAVSDDGSYAAYMTLSPSDGANGAATGSSYVAHRTPSGWATTDANAKVTHGFQSLAIALPVQFSADFQKAILYTGLPLDPDDWDNATNDLYRLDVGLGTASWQTFGTTLPDPSGGFPILLGASPDLRRVVFEVQAGSLLPAEAGADREVYVRDESGIRLVSRLPDGSVPTAAEHAAFPWARGLVLLDTFGSAVAHGGAHGVSDDATRMFFVDRSDLSQPGLYLRIDQPGVAPSTIAVSASERAGDNGAVNHSGIQFIGATHTGDVAYFVSSDPLTDTGTPGGGIYRFERTAPVGHRLEQITPDAGNPSGLGANAILSDDGSHLYFTSPRALRPGAVAGALNLYVWEGGATRLVVTMPTGGMLSRVSRSGQYVVFTSNDSIGGAANNGHRAVYEYDDAARTVVCASCRLDGGRSEGDATLESFPGAPITPSLTEPRNLTDDGTVFFSSADRIVLADQTTASDVYEYRKGALSLLTEGRGDRDSYLADNSDDGRDVFVLSPSQLVPQDRDANELDLYDVRVGGGLPSASEDRTPPCRDDSCQDPPAGPPQLPAPGSTRVTGAADLPAPVLATKKLSISTLSAAKRSQLTRTGKVTLSVSVTGGGTVTVTARGRIGKRTKSLGSVKKVVDGRSTTTINLTFKLSTSARRELTRRGHLSVTFESRLGGLSKIARTTANLTRVHR